MAQAAASLYDRFFQFGYVARDLDAAMSQFNRRFGPVEWIVLTATADYPHMRRVALTFRDGMNVEIIEPNVAVPSLYTDYLPAGVADVQLHHLGFLVEDFSSALDRLRAEGYAIPFCISDSDAIRCFYADARAPLGHYLEYVDLQGEGRALFESIPGFRAWP